MRLNVSQALSRFLALVQIENTDRGRGDISRYPRSPRGHFTACLMVGKTDSFLHTVILMWFEIHKIVDYKSRPGKGQPMPQMASDSTSACLSAPVLWNRHKAKSQLSIWIKSPPEFTVQRAKVIKSKKCFKTESEDVQICLCAMQRRKPTCNSKQGGKWLVNESNMAMRKHGCGQDSDGWSSALRHIIPAACFLQHTIISCNEVYAWQREGHGKVVHVIWSLPKVEW